MIVVVKLKPTATANLKYIPPRLFANFEQYSISNISQINPKNASHSFNKPVFVTKNLKFTLLYKRQQQPILPSFCGSFGNSIAVDIILYITKAMKYN